MAKTAAGLALGLLIATGAPALAQSPPSSGTTSGPAAGNNVQPGATSKKDNNDKTTGATSAGAPGTEAKKGSESGPAPDQKPH